MHRACQPPDGPCGPHRAWLRGASRKYLTALTRFVAIRSDRQSSLVRRSNAEAADAHPSGVGVSAPRLLRRLDAEWVTDSGWCARVRARYWVVEVGSVPVGARGEGLSLAAVGMASVPVAELPACDDYSAPYGCGLWLAVPEMVEP